ncbi:MAG: SGNH/GDSL hydrolase family protein [Lachnospiraceae bacterium]
MKQHTTYQMRRRKVRNILFITLVCLVIVLLAVIILKDSQSGDRQTSQLSEQDKAQWEKTMQEKREEEERIAKYNFYDKLRAGEGIKMAVMGDEIAQQQGRQNPNTGWKDLLESYFKRGYKSSVDSVDLSAYGINVYQGLYQYIRNEDDEQYDVIFLSYGSHDKKEMTTQQFLACYEALIRRIHTACPKAEIVPLISNMMQDSPKLVREMKELFKHYDLPYIDMCQAFEKSRLTNSQLTVDEFYPNDTGYKLYYDTLKTMIDKGVRERREIYDGLPAVLYEDSEQFADLQLIPLENMDEKKNNVYTYETKKSLVGVSYACEANYGGSFKTFLNGQEVDEWQTDEKKTTDKANIIGYSMSGSNEIKIQINEKDKEFVTIYGIILN